MTDMEKQIADCENLIEQGATPQDVRDLGYAAQAVQEAIKQIQRNEQKATQRGTVTPPTAGIDHTGEAV